MESPSWGDPNEGAAEGHDAPQSAVPMLGVEPVSPARPLKHATALFVNGPYTFAFNGLEIDAADIGKFVTGEMGMVASTELAWYAQLSPEELQTFGGGFNERAFLELKRQGREMSGVIDVLRRWARSAESR